MLTSQQKRLLEFLCDQWEEHNKCPSYDEMLYHMGLASRSNAHRLIIALERRGFICRRPNEARSIQIIRRPDGSFVDWGGPGPVHNKSANLIEAATVACRHLAEQAACSHMHAVDDFDHGKLWGACFAQELQRKHAKLARDLRFAIIDEKA